MDIAGTGRLQIHATACTNLRRYLNLPARKPNIIFVAEQLADFGDLVIVACEHDDLVGQKGLLFSADTYRALVKPRHQKTVSGLSVA